MIDNDCTVLKEVINVQKKIIEQLDTNITKLEYGMKFYVLFAVLLSEEVLIKAENKPIKILKIILQILQYSF